jgi:hypothetical protein
MKKSDRYGEYDDEFHYAWGSKSQWERDRQMQMVLGTIGSIIGAIILIAWFAR